MEHELQMEGMSPTEQAKKAIVHMLKRIKSHPQIGYYCGELTETFDLLTEAAATLYGEPVDKVREFYTPTKPSKDPEAVS